MKNNEGSMAESSAVPYEEVISQREKSILSRLNDFIIDRKNKVEGDEKHYGLPIFWDIIQDKAP